MKKQTLIILISILGISTLTSLFLILQNKYKDTKEEYESNIQSEVETDNNFIETPTTNIVTEKEQTSNTEITDEIISYKDGTYSNIQTYFVRGHSENIEVEISIKDGKITQVSNTHSMTDPNSEVYQLSFENSIQSQTVGKNLNDIALSRVGGASDTTSAFMLAINQIKTDAKI